VRPRSLGYVPLLLAHAGHWLVNAAYFVPVVGFLTWLGWTELRARRERRAEPDAHGSGQP
jgi:threonine/homoserine/homoserine lactone efflux protein